MVAATGSDYAAQDVTQPMTEGLEIVGFAAEKAPASRVARLSDHEQVFDL